MAGCLPSPVQEIGKCIWPFLKPHVDYWWCFDSNIQGLRDGIEELKRHKHYIEQEREEARLRTAVLCPGVEEWLKASTEKLEEAQKILLPDENIPKACYLISRYSLGKNAKKTAEEIAKLRNDGNFNTITDPAPPPAMATQLHRLTVDFKSRKSIEDEIIDSLKQNRVGMIGICGMGGIGKTTMAQRIGKRAKEENLFEEVVMATVSQTVDMPKIQNEIAELLGLKLDVESISARAHKLRTRLMDAKRKIIILDDVWDSFKFSEDFELLGIPIESEMCKVLLTTRDANACKGIRSKEVFTMKILEADEAWLLFKDNAGNCVEGVNDVARKVAAECKGLPLALVTVGLALQNITDIYTWNNALSQLRKAYPEDFSEVSRDVYNHLKLSYDFLENDKERDLFLLCCLFPEDFNISVEQLTWYSMGLELFTGVNNIKKARERTHTLVGRLESRSLLIDVEKEGKKGVEVKMHDVIRDVAIYIGSIEKDGFLKSLTSIENSSDVNCNWMSVNISIEQMEVPVLSRFQKLRLLMLSSSNEFYDISHMSFEGMEGLKVLSFESISIPSSLESLKNLQTLRLFRCEIENISVIGKLTSLKILCCCECKNITELPAEIGGLKGLRLLELNQCSNLRRIPFNIISRLSWLEELKIYRSFSKWETGGERRNASLTELEGLRNLTCLEIHISDCTLSAQEIRLEKLVRYRICINNYDNFGDRNYEKVMILYLERDGSVGNWIRQLARNAESLTLIGDGSDNINLAVMENLRDLTFRKCSKVKKLLDTARTRLLQLEVLGIDDCESMEQVFWNVARDNNRYGCIEFSKLEELRLENLPNLTAFCQGLENLIIKFPKLTLLFIVGLPKLNGLFPLNSGTLENTLFCKDVSFCNLKSIYISRCDNLRCLFSVSAAGRYLLQLEDLRIYECQSMEQVFWNDDNINGCIEFPKLKELRLFILPNLTAFGQGLENFIIHFPNLTRMNISKLPKLNSLFPHNSKDLLQLEYLSIQDCESMEQVIWSEGTDDNTDGCIIEFPKLKKLRLWNLPNLTAFCQGLENNIIKFPNLIELDIIDLPKLNSLFPPNSKDDNLRYLFPASMARRCLLQLEYLCINGCESMEQVFWNEDRDAKTDGCIIEFPKMKQLRLLNLPKLTAFCQGLENIIIKFPNLTEMVIRGLPKLKRLLSPPNSEILENTCFHLFCNPNPKDDNLRYLFPASMARTSLLQLEDLHIYDCESMEQVFWNEDRDDNTDGCIEFPKLKELRLWKLPNLTAFCQGLENIIIKFPNLTELEIGGLPKLNSLSPLNSETVVWHDQNTSFHFVCNPKVEMGLLKELTLSRFEDNIKNIWCHQISNNFFNNLERLYISFMNGIRSLMSTSIAKNLVSLKFLWIEACKEMVEVIGIDDDNDKQVVDINRLFPNLSKLELYNLHKLIRFWQWNHALELPLLEEIYISNCPAMETFTLGSINTPNIREISINAENIEDHKDLNDVIRHMRTKSQDTFENKEDWIEEDGNEYANKDENTEESIDEYDNDNVNKDKTT